MTREERRKRSGSPRGYLDLDTVGDLPPNVVRFPRRLRHYASWADLVASYEPRPVEPGKVLAVIGPEGRSPSPGTPPP